MVAKTEGGEDARRGVILKTFFAALRNFVLRDPIDIYRADVAHIHSPPGEVRCHFKTPLKHGARKRAFNSAQDVNIATTCEGSQRIRAAKP